MQRMLMAVVLAVLMAAAVGWRTVAAQSGNIAFCTFSSQFAPFGPLQPNATGWDWFLTCAVNSSPGSIIQVNAQTLTGDSLAQVGQKLANAVKAQAAAVGATITTVLLPSTAIVTPQ